MSVQLHASAALPWRKGLPLLMGYGVGLEVLKKRKISCFCHVLNQDSHADRYSASSVYRLPTEMSEGLPIICNDARNISQFVI